MTAPIQIHPTAALREVTALAEHYRQRNLALAHDLLITTQENEDLKAKLATYEPQDGLAEVAVAEHEKEGK